MADETGIKLKIEVEGVDEAALDLASLDKSVAEIIATSENAEVALKKLSQKLEEANKVSRQGGSDIDKLSGQIGGLDKMLRSAGNAVLDFGKGLIKGFTLEKAIESAFEFRDSCMAAQKQLDDLSNSFKNSFGAEGQRRLANVSSQCRELGLNFQTTAAQARTFFEQGKNSALASEMDRIFAGVATAGRALDLTEKQISGVLNDLSGLAKQGTISFHDLADGLGQNLPNALDTAASAMGMTTSELATFAAQGKLVADDLLPKLGAALREEYAQAAEEAADTVDAQTERMWNAWDQFKANLASSGPAVFFVRFIADGLEAFNATANAAREYDQIKKDMKAAGFKPDMRVDSWGIENYSPSMVAAWKNQTYDDERATAWTESKKQEENQALTDYSRLSAKTQTGKIASLTSEIEQAQNTINARIEVAKAQGASETKIKEIESQGDAILKELKARQKKAQNQLDKLLAGPSKKTSTSAATAAHKAAVAQADYTAKIAATEAQAAKLAVQLGKNGTVEEQLARERDRIEAEYQAQLEKDAKERTSMQGRISASELESYKIAQDKVAVLNRDLKIRDAEKQAVQKSSQLAQGQMKVMQEIAQLSGSHYSNLELQKVSIAAQARELQETYQLTDDIVARWQELQLLYASDDPFDASYRGLLRFSAEYSDSAKDWENLSYNFAKNFTSTTRNMFDEFLETGEISLESFGALFRQLLKDLAWQALAQPVIMSVVGGVAGAVSGGTAGSQGAAAMTQSGGGSGSILDAGMGLAQNYGMGQIKDQLLGSGGLMGGITDSINSAVASWFPSTFTANSSIANGTFVGPLLPGTPTQTFTSALATPAIGAGIGAMASPFVNNLLGIQNNTGSQIGSLVGGGLGTVGGALLAAAPAMAAVPGIGWIGAGVAGLASLLGGGIGGLLGFQEQDEPAFDMGFGVYMHNRPGTDYLTNAQGSPMLTDQNDGKPASYQVSAHATSGASGQLQWNLLPVLQDTAKSVVDTSWQFADALGNVSKSMKEDYLAALEAQGGFYMQHSHKGGWINDEVINNSLNQFRQTAVSQIMNALGNVSLAPLTKAADGFAARTVDDITIAFGKLFEFANISTVLDDEETRTQFAENAVGQITAALENVSFAPLATAADGFAVNTMDELTKSLEDMFGLYDQTASIQDEKIRAAVQSWAQQAIESAFSKVDLSFLRVDFDKETFGGLQKAYAATQAWKTVTDSIDGVLNPISEFDAAMQAIDDQFDAWISNLKQLGWQEGALAEIEKKRIDYLAETQRQLEKEMRQNLSLRFSSLYYGSGSREYELQSLLFEQANEREQWKGKFGENHELYQTGLGIQRAELTQTLLEQFKAMRDELLEQEKQQQQDQLNLQMSSLQEEISERGKLVSQTQQLADKFRRLARSLEEYRHDLWSGQDNLTGTRYREAYSQFDDYFRKALAGDEDAFNELKDKAGVVLQLGREQLETRGEYNDAFYDIDQKLKQAQQAADSRASAADSQLAALNGIIASLETQQGYLQAQLDALNRQTEAERESQFTLSEIEAAIRMLEQGLNTQLGKQPVAGADMEQWISAKIGELNAIAYKGDFDWTRDEVLAEFSAQGIALEGYFQQQDTNDGYALHTLELGNDAAQANANRAFKQADSNTGLLNDSLLQNISAIGIGNSSLSSLIGVNSGGWNNTLSSMAGLNSGLSSIFGGITGVGSGVGAVNSSLGGLNSGLGSLNGSIGGLNGGLSSIYSLLVKWATGAMDGENIYGGTITGYGGSTTGWTAGGGNYNGVNGTVSQTPIYGSDGYYSDAEMMTVLARKYNMQNYLGSQTWTAASAEAHVLKYYDNLERWWKKQGWRDIGFAAPAPPDPLVAQSPNRLPGPTGVFGSYYANERDLMNARVWVMNQTGFQGRNDWTANEWLTLMRSEGFPSQSDWYQKAGWAEGYATGGITPANTPFWTGEGGPELVVARQSYGVLNHKASMALANAALNERPAQGDDAKTVAELKQGFALMANYLRQIVVKTDTTAHNCAKITTLLRKLDDLGLLEVEA